MTFLMPAARIARTLAIGLWVGAMAGFAFIFAPAAFHVLGGTPAFATIIATTIRALTAFGAGCAAIALISTWLLKESRLRTGILVAALIGMLGLSIIDVALIVPKMERTALHTAAYANLHGESSAVYAFVLLLGMVSWAAVSIRDREG